MALLEPHVAMYAVSPMIGSHIRLKHYLYARDDICHFFSLAFECCVIMAKFSIAYKFESTTEITHATVKGVKVAQVWRDVSLCKCFSKLGYLLVQWL